MSEDRVLHTRKTMGSDKLGKQVYKSNYSRVYQGELADGRLAAVKIWKKNDDARHMGKVERLMLSLVGERHPETPRLPKRLETASMADWSSKRPGSLVTVLEYIPGVSLQQVIESRPYPDSVDIGLAIVTGIEVCDALSYLHKFQYDINGSTQGFVHRDVKPGNILMRDDGSFTLIDLATCGLRNTVPELIYGTPEYCPPEALGSDDVALHPRIDIYGLGVVIYELITHVNPFSGETDSEKRNKVFHKVPDRMTDYNWDVGELACGALLEDIVSTALKKNPDERFLNVDQFREQLCTAYCLFEQECGQMDYYQLTHAAKVIFGEGCSPLDQRVLAVYAREFMAIAEANRQQEIQRPSTTAIPPLESVAS